MVPGIELKIIRTDGDLLELRVSASNDSFQGVTCAYIVRKDFADLADHLHGFPTSAEDQRTLTFGAVDATFAGGGVTLKFLCEDAAGHPIAEVWLRTDPHDSNGREQSVLLLMSIEAAGVDAFVVALANMGCTVGATAFLPTRKG